jgi:cytochrome P450
LRADRELVPVAVEESLRHDPPIRFLLRNCMEERELHGEQLCPGDKVAFGLLSANRDETVFEDPHAFRLDRPDPRSHVAFGGGPHVCPGASLARLEARVALNVFLDRVDRIEPVDPGRYEEVPVAWAHGPRRLDARITPTV